MLRAPLVGLAALVLLIGTATPARAAQPYPVAFHRFELSTGSVSGLTRTSGSLVIGSGTTSGTYIDPYGKKDPVAYDAGTWTSDWLTTTGSDGAPFSELVASWNAVTPDGTWLQTRMQARTDKGTTTKWYILGRWTFGDGTIYRTSVGGQGDADGFVAIDTFFAKDHLMTAYRLEVTLYRAQGSGLTPRLDFIGAVASNAPNLNPYVPSAHDPAATGVLDVTTYSQEIHAGQYPQFDSGGEAWCSPTSTSMILRYWLPNQPPASDYGYVLTDYPDTQDPWVDYAARYTFDYHYHGAGNWPFNAAYAAHFGLRGFVTQLRSLYEAEQFIKAGIPLVASIAFTSNKLDGFLFKSTGGHLLTIVGFTASGDVMSNDPASRTDGTVKHVYDRQQFERDWLSSTGGIVYVIRPASTALPANIANQPANW
ncbi:MAG: hypothetical protein AUH85_03600 [Chloroflexi bacterium 13_1_40CM_4_68_4]|nr:MAG: hypothetical protein AUH85_03600 [Chloroflexi bacterium 13_1_40CM_4_68_4]